MKKSYIIIALVVVIGLAMVGCSNGEEEPATISFAGSGGYPPFNYYEGEDVVGFDVDVAQEIADRLDMELDYVTSDWDGLIDGLKAERFDGILGSMAINPDRAEKVNFTTPYYYSGAQLFVRDDSDIQSFEDLEDASIGVATGTTFEDDAWGLEGVTNVELYTDDNLTILDLVAGRIDGVITDRLVGINAINEGQGIRQVGELIRLEEMAVALHPDDAELLTDINAVLEEMHNDGTLTSISEKWFDGLDITVK